MLRWLRHLRGSSASSRLADIPDHLWQQTLDRFPFLDRHGAQSLSGLRRLTRQFLRRKEFHGVGGLHISDGMAVAIAAQACLPILRIRAPFDGLDWYSDFVGIVVHAGAVRARRELTDDAGIVHSYSEILTGEAMQDGPVMLSWQDVADAGRSAARGYNLVVHEFVHKIDMRDGAPDGCPPLPEGFMAAPTVGAARRAWIAALNRHYLDFCDRVSIAERFSGPQPWLDSYAAHSISEFFAVASEAYFVKPDYFARDFEALVPMFDAFFNPAQV